jgi:hypothetical protein
MPANLTAPIVVNSALQQIASQTQITALNDGSSAAKAATIIYAPTVQLMLRELDPAFARFTAALSVAVNPSQVVPWTYEYAYPADCVRVRQIRPPASPTAGFLADPNDPVPIQGNVAFDLISSVNTKVILTNQQNALLVYTTLTVTEAQWDAAFTDALVRRLANPLAMALSGRPDFAKTILEESAQMAATCEVIDDYGFRRAG